MGSTPSTEHGWAISSAAALALALALSGCAAKGAPAELPSISQTETEASRVSVPEEARYQVRMEGTLTRLFASETLEDFALQDEIANVIRGTVLKTRAIVSQPGNVVETILTVEVVDQRESGPSHVEVREQGGVVAVADVRSDFEEKTGRKLTPKDLREQVNFQFADTPHAHVGDDVLLVVGADEVARETAYVGLVRLEAISSADAGARGVAPATYEWPGESPNPQWEDSVAADTLLK